MGWWIISSRIECVSLGGLVSGITLEDISYGISVTRNEKIANVFYRFKLVEAYGTGISKVFESYELSKIKLTIDVSQTMAGRILRQLTEKNILLKRGKAANTNYVKNPI